MHQIHLVGKGLSGRGVRYKVLSASDVESADFAAGRECTPNSLQAEFTAKAERLGMHMMVQAITEPSKVEDLHTKKWRKVSPAALDAEWDKLFNVKDTITLKKIYHAEHTVSKEDVDAIMEKKVTLVDESED